MTDYIYSYNCLPISQFYSDFKIAQNCPVLIIYILLVSEKIGHGFSGLFIKCDKIMNNFCNIIIHNSLKFAWNFCENIGPSTLYRCAKFERNQSMRRLFLHALKIFNLVQRRRNRSKIKNWMIFRSTYLMNYQSNFFDIWYVRLYH